MNYDILLIDGPYLAHRSFSAPYKLKTRTGHDSTMIHTFMLSLRQLKKKFLPDEIIIAWESHGTQSWRRELYLQYKPLKTIPESFVHQLNDLKILLHSLGYKQFKSPENEADDVIATYVFQEPQKNIVIFTVDKDIMQLINQKTHIYDGKRIVQDIDVKQKFGVKPYQIPDLLALTGDSADNIKGVQNIGLRKASKLLAQYETVENIPDSIIPKNLVLLNKKLTTLNKTCNLLSYIPLNDSSIDDITHKYELRKIQEEIDTFKIKKEVKLENFF